MAVAPASSPLPSAKFIDAQALMGLRSLELRARAVVVDMECGVVGSLMRVSVGGWQGVRAGARAGNRGGVAARRSPAVEPPTSLCRSPPPSATSAATFPIRRAPFASSLMRGSS